MKALMTIDDFLIHPGREGGVIREIITWRTRVRRRGDIVGESPGQHACSNARMRHYKQGSGAHARK